jgi:hypothetical protein
MGKREAADMSGEKYLKGRTAGVEKTYGASRGKMHSAEKTIIGGSMEQSNGGTLDPELSGAVKRMHARALETTKTSDGDGDKAITER